MSTLTTLGARRIRSLSDIGHINLAPITILLGRNSVGKSTFARLFPLLRQSAERKKRAPILWYDDLVDFGGFSETVTRGKSSIELLLTIDKINNKYHRPRTNYFFDGFTPQTIDLSNVEISLTLSQSAADATYASEINIRIDDNNCRLKIDETNELESIQINNKSYKLDQEKWRILTEQGAILPKLIFAQKKKPEEGIWTFSRNPWRNALIDSIFAYVHGNTSRGTIAKIASRIPLSNKHSMCEASQNIDGPNSWIHLRKQITPDSEISKKFMEGAIISNIDTLIELIDDSLNQIVKGIRYLKPLRATAERHYRRADLSVSEIDPEGRNLPIFLDSLPRHSLDQFREWLKENLDIDVEPKRQGAQIVLMAKGPNDKAPSNVADMGFGISQVLPIAAQLWASTTARINRSEKTSFIVIEQPELHLHPAFQANLSNLFAGVTKSEGMGRKESENRPKLIIETHSPHIVYRLGALISEKVLNPEDVSIVLFEPNHEQLGTSIARVANFNENGILQNWPYGFFEPDQ